MTLGSDSQLDNIVYKYLVSKGYKNSSVAFLQEGQTKSFAELEAEFIDRPIKDGFEVSIPNWILFDQGLEALHDSNGSIASDNGSSGEKTASKRGKQTSLYEKTYRSLRNWLENGIDRYKNELQPILFPIFVHLYLELVNKGVSAQAKQFFECFQNEHKALHGDELAALAGVTEPAHLQESELAQRFKKNKYGVRLSRYSFELLLDYLQQSNLVIILGILNQCFSMQVVVGADGCEDSDLGLIGCPPSEMHRVNKEPCQLGVPKFDMRILDEMERRLKVAIEHKSQGNRMDVEDIEPIESGYIPDKPEAVLEVIETIKAEPSADAELSQVPLPTQRLADIDIYMKQLEDASCRIPLGKSVLPSVCCFTFQNTFHELTSITTSPDLSLTAAGMADSLIHVWSLDNKEKQHHRYIGHSGPVYSVSFSSDSRYLISGSADKTARLWSTETQLPLACFRGHNYPVWDVSFGPFGSYFATASYDRTARLWSTDDLRPLRIFAGHLDDVHTVRFHPNSAYVLTGSGDCTSRMWDVTSGQSVRLFKRHKAGIYNISASPDGRLLATAGEDLAIHLWDLGMGKCIKSFKGHTGAIQTLSFSSDSALLASGGLDNTVRVYDVLTGPTSDQSCEEPLKTFYTKQTPIYDLHFTRRNLLLAFGVFS